MEKKLIEAIEKFIKENTIADGDFGELSFRDFVGGDEKKIATKIIEIIKPIIKKS